MHELFERPENFFTADGAQILLPPSTTDEYANRSDRRRISLSELYQDAKALDGEQRNCHFTRMMKTRLPGTVSQHRR